MVLCFKYMYRIMPVICCMVLATLLVACGDSTSSTPTPTAIPKPSSTPAPSPTSSTKVYMGDGFSISYPQNWNVKTKGNAVSFTDPTEVDVLIIAEEPNPNGVASAEQVASAEVSAAKVGMTNEQVVNIPPTTTVAGESWVQKSISGTTKVNGQSTVVQLVVIADNHPENSPASKSFSIFYGADKTLFPSVFATYFQSMLASFKFTS